MNLRGLVGALLLLSAGRLQAQVDTFHVQYAVDSTLPDGVVGTTICNPQTGQPIVLVNRQDPGPSVMVHEAVHVMQILRAGGCPDGYVRITATAQALLELEAEAYCVEAGWAFRRYGKEPRKTLAEALRWLVDFSAVRAKIRGPEWELTPGQVSAAFAKFCPSLEPQYIIGRTEGTRVSNHYVSESPLTNKLRLDCWQCAIAQ